MIRDHPRSTRDQNVSAAGSGSAGKAASTAAAMLRGSAASSAIRVSTDPRQAHTTVADGEAGVPPRTQA
ncbi:MAG: hypothetical protein GC157_04320 [Frankiales bacterium]|nr:hypothetical protein [Frankiales bacterium]